jgi:hypothetical protein
MSRKKQLNSDLVSADLWSEEYVAPTTKTIKSTCHTTSRECHQDKFVVTAGTHRFTGRQMFLSTFDIGKEWSISVVPSIMSIDRAQKMMSIAEEYVADNPKKYGNRLPVLKIESVTEEHIYPIVKCLLKNYRDNS